MGQRYWQRYLHPATLKHPLLLRFRRTTSTKRQRLREATIIAHASIVGMLAQGDAVRHRGSKCVTEPVEVDVPSVTVCHQEPPATEQHVLATPISVHMAISSSVLKTFQNSTYAYALMI